MAPTTEPDVPRPTSARGRGLGASLSVRLALAVGVTVLVLIGVAVAVGVLALTVVPSDHPTPTRSETRPSSAPPWTDPSQGDSGAAHDADAVPSQHSSSGDLMRRPGVPR